MASVAIKKITNGNVYMNGTSLLGKVEEFEPPKITHKMAEHKALGLIGTPEYFAGIDKMEARLKWSSLYADSLGIAADPTKAVNLMLRGNLETQTSQGKTGEVPAVVYMTAMFKDFPTGNFKQHENSEYESMATVTYVKMEVDSQPVLEIDILANIYKVNGVDILAKYKANLGI